MLDNRPVSLRIPAELLARAGALASVAPAESRHAVLLRAIECGLALLECGNSPVKAVAFAGIPALVFLDPKPWNVEAAIAALERTDSE